MPPITLELARKSSAFGCNEPAVPGMDSGMIIGTGVSAPMAFELVLSNGWSRLYSCQLGLETGDPRLFASFDDFREAFRKQLSYMVEKASGEWCDRWSLAFGKIIRSTLGRRHRSYTGERSKRADIRAQFRGQNQPRGILRRPHIQHASGSYSF